MLWIQFCFVCFLLNRAHTLFLIFKFQNAFLSRLCYMLLLKIWTFIDQSATYLLLGYNKAQVIQKTRVFKGQVSGNIKRLK